MVPAQKERRLIQKLVLLLGVGGLHVDVRAHELGLRHLHNLDGDVQRNRDEVVVQDEIPGHECEMCHVTTTSKSKTRE